MSLTVQRGKNWGIGSFAPTENALYSDRRGLMSILPKNTPTTSAIARETIVNAVSSPPRTFLSKRNDSDLYPTDPGTRRMIPGNWKMLDGLF